MCNQTVGLVQRELEHQGITTVGISIARSISEKVKPPRTYHLKYPFGHALGELRKVRQQQQIVEDCLKLMETATEPGVITDSPYRWKRHNFE
ncbi:MAG: hypothetical protein HQM11_11865 [SAR324 cluster bacterium]|nr:hypothetical protein [SAR324 cluster bacterium]